MSNFSERYTETTHATLFTAWYELQPPRVQAKLAVWIFVLADYHMVGKTLPETAVTMAESTLWAVYEKNPRQFAALLERPMLEPVKG